MNPTIINLIIQLVAGAVGGNAAGGLMKQWSLGTVGNSIAGIVGGGLGGQLLGMLLAGSGAAAGGASGGGLDVGSIVTQIVGGGVGGGVLLVIVGLIRQLMGGQTAR